MTDTTEEQKFEILDEKTVRTIDYILRGLELGKFDDTAQKVEFLGKLSGENEPKYIATLLKRISELENHVAGQESAINTHLNRLIELEQYKVESEAKLNTLQNDMRSVAIAIRQIFEPKPLKNSYDMSDIDTFCNRYGANSY